jgi:hypothetical protein
MLVVGDTFWRQLEVARRTVQQLKAELSLEQTDGFTYGGWAYKERLGRSREAAAIDSMYEIGDPPQFIHHAHA